MIQKIEVDVQYTENDFVRGMKSIQTGYQSKTLNTVFYILPTILGYVLVYTFLIRSGGKWNWEDA